MFKMCTIIFKHLSKLKDFEKVWGEGGAAVCLFSEAHSVIL